MKLNRRRPHVSWPTCCTALGVLLLAGVSRADVKLTCEVATTRGTAASVVPVAASSRQTEGPGGQAPPAAVKPATVTVSYRGKLARSEAVGGPLALYNGAAGTVYSLTPNQMTYRVFALSDLLSRPDVLQAPPGAGGTGFDVTVRLDKTEATRLIAGKQVQRYVLTASMQPKPASHRGGDRKGRHKEASASGADASSSTPDQSGLFSHPSLIGEGPRTGKADRRSLQVTGEYWLADAALLPAGAASPLLPLLRQTLTAGPLLKELSAQLAKMKLVPLAGAVTVVATEPSGRPQAPVTMTLAVRTIAEGALDDSLFKIPSGYMEVPADM